jgi:hypothetical protein
MPVRWGLLVILLLVVTGQDIVSAGDFLDYESGYSTASVWQLRIGSVNPSWIIFGCLLIQLLKINKIELPSIIKRVVWSAPLWLDSCHSKQRMGLTTIG